VKPSTAQVYTAPAPVGGWNARDAFPVMAPTEAITLDNVFPESNLCRVVGAGVETDSYTTSDGFIETFAQYLPNTGGYKAIVSDNTYFRILNSAGEFEGSTYTHSSGNRWESVNFRGSIILVNGSAAPKAWNGSAWSSPSYTGISDPTTLSHVDAYKSRLFFCQTQSLSIWYSASVNQISGVLTEYDISGIVRRGGYVLFAGSLTKDIGSGLSDIFVIVTNQGEVIFFSGDNPSASNWVIAGRAYIGIPMGKRAFCSYKSDLLIATTEGIFSCSDILQSGSSARALTDNIQLAYNEVASAASDYDGWELHYWPSGHMLVLNVPQNYPVSVHQYCMNTFTGAWCRIKGNNASAFCLMGNDLFFASPQGSSNSIQQFDAGANPPDEIEIQGAFLPLGSASVIKQAKSIRAFWNGPRYFSYYLECLADFESRRYSNLVRKAEASSTEWGDAWGSPWNLGERSIANFTGVESRVGVFYSYKIKSRMAAATAAGQNPNDFVPAAGTTISAVSYIFEPGGIL